MRIAEAIDALHAAGHRLAVVTAKIEPHARRVLASLPFGDRFEDVIGATVDGRLSHKLELIGEALRRFGVAPDAYTMIGDRHLDIDGARHQRMRGVGVLWGFGSAEKLAEADALARTPSALPSLLDWGRPARLRLASFAVSASHCWRLRCGSVDGHPLTAMSSPS